MPVNHARPQNTSGRVVDLNRRRTERVHALLALREQFAAAHAAYEAHGRDAEALQMWQQAAQVESEIRKMSPRIYAQRWTEWVERDTALMHGPGERNARCMICTLAEAAGLPVAG
jgi:hypothetical protein